jgi:hypothetical protein
MICCNFKSIVDWLTVASAIVAGVAWSIAACLPVSRPMPRITADFDADAFNQQMSETDKKILRGTKANRYAAFLTAVSALLTALSTHLSHTCSSVGG